MRDVWETKDGRRRVRVDPPTVEDAVLAAQGLTDEVEEQVEIVMSLMPVSDQEARRAVLKMKRSGEDSRLTIRAQRRAARGRRRAKGAAADGEAFNSRRRQRPRLARAGALGPDQQSARKPAQPPRIGRRCLGEYIRL